VNVLQAGARGYLLSNIKGEKYGGPATKSEEKKNDDNKRNSTAMTGRGRSLLRVFFSFPLVRKSVGRVRVVFSKGGRPLV